jgi:O-antigen ligase
LTCGLVAVLGLWAIVTRPRIDAVGWALIGFVTVQALLVLTNEYGWMRGLAPVARSLTWVFAYLLARTVFGTRSGVVLAGAFVAIGMIPAAVSGTVQWVMGAGLLQNGATRVAGIYGTSPVGMALAMQAAAFAIFGIMGIGALRRPIGRLAVVAIVLFVIDGFVLVQTNTRLVFASFFVGLGLVEVLRRHYRGLAVVGLVAIVVLVAQPELNARIVTTGAPAQTQLAAASNESTASQPLTATPDNGAALGDASLRFRQHVWTALLRAWLTSPIIGLGTGSVPEFLETQVHQPRIPAHNDYLGILTENGIVGLTLFCLVQALVLLALLRRLRGPDVRLRDQVLAALAIFLTMDVMNSLNNAMLYLDLQLIGWTVLGATIAASPPAALAARLRWVRPFGRPAPGRR